MTDGPILHEPLRATRSDVPGEVAFMARWQALMDRLPRVYEEDEEAPMLASILCLPGGVRPRDAAVAASFVQWLGTNLGTSFLRSAEMVNELPWASRNGVGGHQTAWGAHNRRKPHVDGGLRAIELMLVPGDAPRGRLGLPLTAPDLSARDHEVVEQVVQWLDTDEGGRFLDTVVRDIERAHDEVVRRRRAAYA